jgi:hypothetical protein
MTSITTQSTQAALVRAFRNLADQVDPETLRLAIAARDSAAIYAAFGISPDGATWPELERAIAEALHDTLAPLIASTTQDEQDALGATLTGYPSDASHYEGTHASIVTDTLAGFVAAVALLLVSTASGANFATRLRQSVGMTESQANLFVLTQQTVDNLLGNTTGRNFDKLRTGTSNQSRSAFLAPALQALPPIVRNALLRMLDQAEGRAIQPRDLEALFSRLSRHLVDYRTRAVADLAAVAAVNAALLGVWLVAQAAGLLPSDAKKYWHDRADDRVRVSHHQIEQMNARGVPLNEPFANPLGKTLMYPPAEFGCRCRVSLHPPRGVAG